MLAHSAARMHVAGHRLAVALLLFCFVDASRADDAAPMKIAFMNSDQDVEPLEPPLPPNEFNPDPGGGKNVEEEVPPPPDLFPPILPQPPEYGSKSRCRVR